MAIPANGKGEVQLQVDLAEPDETPLKICFPFGGNTLGGSHLSTLLLTQALDRRQFDPMILVHRDGPLAAHLRQNAIPFRLVPESWILEFRARTALRDGRRLLPGTGAMVRFLRDEDVAIVHTNDNRMNTTWGPTARLAGCRFVWHQRTRPFLTRRMRLIARLADRIVCISDYCSEAFRTPAFEGRLSVVNNPFVLPADRLDKAAARSRLLAEIETSPETRLIAFVANLRPHKRPEIFVEAARRITVASTEPVAFPVFGEPKGPHYQAMIQRIDALGLRSRFHFLGFRNPIDPWIAACDLLLSPSIEEGFGRTLVEAMLCETPVVAADSGGYREIVEHGVTGLLAPVDDPTAFAEASLSILRDPKRTATLTKAAASNAESKFGVEVHVEQMAAIYSSLSTTARRQQDKGI